MLLSSFQTRDSNLQALLLLLTVINMAVVLHFRFIYVIQQEQMILILSVKEAMMVDTTYLTKVTRTLLMRYVLPQTPIGSSKIN